MDWGISVLGLLVGLLVGLTGVGGASLLTPLLVLFGIHPTVAVGTDLFYNSITKLFGTIQHYRQKTIDMKLALYFAAGSIPGAIASIGLLHMFESMYQNQEQIIRTALGIMLVITAILTIVKQFSPTKDTLNRMQQKPLEQKKTMTIGIGFVLGAIVGLTSIGSGSLFAIAMMYVFHLPASRLVGTDIAHAMLLVTAAGLMHAGFGNVDYMLAFQLLIGSVPGVWLGSALTTKIPARPLRTVMAALIFMSGLKLL